MRTCICVFFILSFNIFSQWQIINAVNTTNGFIDVSVVNSNVIWALLNDTSNNIYRSTNGGVNWQLSGSLYVSFGAITAVDENTAWVSGIGNIYRLYKTTDGGSNWLEQTYSPRNYINFIKFFTANVGFFVSDATNDTVGFFYTRNGGVNWTRSSNSPISSYMSFLLENCINALDSNLIWICSSTGPSVFKFYRLTGGFSSLWQVFDYGYSGAFRNALFKNANEGLVTDGQKVLYTSSGGTNWIIRNSRSAGISIRDFIHVPGKEWVIVNSINKIMVSYDFCVNWHDSLNYFRSLYGDAKSYNSVWLAGFTGQLLFLDYNQIGISLIGSNIPKAFELFQNFPNPFNPQTKIRFSLPIASDFSIKVYDISGKEVYSVYDSKQAGEYEFTFDGSAYASGVYFYQLRTDGFVETKRMVILK